MPVPYCIPVDVARKYNPQLTQSNITSDDYIGNEDYAQIRARIGAVSDEWDNLSGTAMRELREGSPGEPRTWEFQDARTQRRRYPLRVSLDHDDIVPIDPSVDTIEVREGRDDWRDVTGDEGDEWVLEYDTGEMKLFEFLVNRIWFEAPDDRYLRTTYRYGALGGARDRGGQTTLTSSVDSNTTTTSLDVTDASRLPADGGVLLVGSGEGAEYVRATNVDTSTDTLTVSRAARATTASAHSSDEPVHYCPLNVRDAVAAKTARELLRYEDWVDELVDASNLDVGAAEKMRSWQDNWETQLANNSAVRRM